jgi:hypothetical protein
VDLTCGIGGDLVAFARAGLTTAGIDLDPLRVEIARANLTALGSAARSRWETHDARRRDLRHGIRRPGRRGARGRSFHADDWTPPWTFVESLLTRRACVKVAPGSPTRSCPTEPRRSGSATRAR